jgi:uncharacterized UPF0160 family protein
MTQNLYTHNGLFHADDVFAAAMFSIMFNEDIKIVRGGDDSIPADTENWIVFDIGGGELDHHTPENKENNGVHPGTNVPYASCGLVWRKYYHEILSAVNCPDKYMDKVYEKLERSLILGIDGHDNGFDGVNDACSDMPNLQDDQKKILISQASVPYTVSRMIADFNPSWESDRNPDAAFMDAVSFARDILFNRFDSIMDALDARDFIYQHIDFSSDHMMVLEHFAPWQGIVTSRSRGDEKAKDLWYVVSPALRGGWNVQCVLDDPDDRTSYRHPLPESWYGLRAEELQNACGVADARFCHPSGFLCGADSEAGALSMADIAKKSK